MWFILLKAAASRLLVQSDPFEGARAMQDVHYLHQVLTSSHWRIALFVFPYMQHI